MTINETLETLTGLTGVRVYTELPTSAQPPCVYVRDVTVDYQATFGLVKLTVDLVVLVQYADKSSAPRKLNDLLDWSALPAELVELGFTPTSASDKALYSFGGATLLGSELQTTIEIEV